MLVKATLYSPECELRAPTVPPFQSFAPGGQRQIYFIQGWNIDDLNISGV
jgi:hypothetical protein